MPDLMSGPRLKIERADHHIDQLVSIFRTHIDDYIKPGMIKGAPRGGRWFNSEISNELPKHTSTVIGDAVHNLRVALEHAYWVAVERNGGSFARQGAFPFDVTKASLEARLNSWKPKIKPDQRVVRFIVDKIQPFDGGRLSLYDLHKLDIMDKHELLIPALMTLRFRKGDELRIHTPGRDPLVIFGSADNTGFIGGPNLDGLFSVENGWFEFTGDIYHAFSALFGRGPMDQRPVVETLRLLSQNTQIAVSEIEALLQ